MFRHLIGILLMMFLIAIVTTQAVSFIGEDIEHEFMHGIHLYAGQEYSYENLRKYRALEAHMDFERLKKHAGYDARLLRLIIVDEPRINASIDSFGNIRLYQGMIDFNGPFREHTVSVLAHEIAHWTEGHLRPTGYHCDISLSGSRMCEKSADIAGQRLMDKAGYDACEASGIWLRLLMKYGNLGGSSHPTMWDRFNYLRCY